ncbi:6-carboxytetrahydropterin synthase [Virgibacillus senegalensis]|uniref:6-carboxytetrahydropterin synthase n=1 Tax=Virgibacillus senegalensis TaxID=1499679 RepID=UPI00069FA17F|nr:6-carboxytetrahydropterin synthase [Virgibacillus senegalensis]
MVYLSRKLRFSAMHSYRIQHWTEEKNQQVFGLCSNPNGHGHDYQLEVMVKGDWKDRTGIVVNTTDIKQVVGSIVEEELDGKFLNKENIYFREKIPTTENLLIFLWNKINRVLQDCELHRLRLHENSTLYSEKGEGDMVSLTRKYHFSAAHRLHSDKLTDSENKQLFGKCNNVYGHGHNYYLEVSVQGIPDPVTGMVTDIAVLDEIVESVVLKKFDHKHLNLDTTEFDGLNPTSEVMTQVIYQMLSPYISNLSKIGLWETENNYFEYVAPTGGEAHV